MERGPIKERPDTPRPPAPRSQAAASLRVSPLIDDVGWALLERPKRTLRALLCWVTDHRWPRAHAFMVRECERCGERHWRYVRR